MKTIEEMRKDGYPLKIKGNGGYKATLKDCQPLFDGDYMAIYSYPGGECCHDIEEIKRCFEVIEQQPKGGGYAAQEGMKNDWIIIRLKQ